MINAIQQLLKHCAQCRQDISNEDDYTGPPNRQRSEQERHKAIQTNNDLEEQRGYNPTREP